MKRVEIHALFDELEDHVWTVRSELHPGDPVANALSNIADSIANWREVAAAVPDDEEED
jgi:hypothetical protein